MKYLVSLLVAGSMFTAQAGTLTVDQDLELIAVNGQGVSVQELALTEGTHVLQMRYAGLLEQRTAKMSGTWVYSNPLFVKVTMKANEDLHITLPELETVRAANNFVAQPVVTLDSSLAPAKQIELTKETALLAKLM